VAKSLFVGLSGCLSQWVKQQAKSAAPCQLLFFILSDIYMFCAATNHHWLKQGRFDGGQKFVCGPLWLPISMSETTGKECCSLPASLLHSWMTWWYHISSNSGDPDTNTMILDHVGHWVTSSQDATLLPLAVLSGMWLLVCTIKSLSCFNVLSSTSLLLAHKHQWYLRQRVVFHSNPDSHDCFALSVGP